MLVQNIDENNYMRVLLKVVGFAIGALGRHSFPTHSLPSQLQHSAQFFPKKFNISETESS